MTTRLEDRLRNYGTTLDRTALADTTSTGAESDRADTTTVVAFRTSGKDHPGRRLQLVAAAAASLALIAAGVWTISRRHDTGESVQSNDTPTAAQPLLFPPGPTPTGAPIFVPPGRHTTVVASPTGAAFTIDVMENFWGTMPAGTVIRDVNGRTFGLLTGDTQAADMAIDVYGALDECSMVITKGEVDPDPWNDAALALLGAEQIDNGRITVNLPAGWTIEVPPGAQVTGYDYTIGDGVAGGQTTIVSTPSATAGTIFGLYGPPTQIRPADFDGHRAWFSTYPATKGGTNAHLTWEAAGNAYDITARDATQAQLVAFARTLVPASIADFAARNPDAGQASTATVGSTAPSPTGGCPTRALQVQTAA